MAQCRYCGGVLGIFCTDPEGCAATARQSQMMEVRQEPASAPPPKRAPRKRAPSRSQRWSDAIAKAQEAIAAIESTIADLEQACADLRSVQEEYEEWRDSLPENLRDSAVGTKLDAVCELEIEDLSDKASEALDEVREIIGEAEGLELPQGFGRD